MEKLLLEGGKTYFTKHGRFVKLDSEHFGLKGVFNGYYEKDGRQGDSGRWKSNGAAWNYLSDFSPWGYREMYFPEQDIIMEDCAEARKIANQMKLERKQKAAEETMKIILTKF
jgi:hypothetical protein